MASQWRGYRPPAEPPAPAPGTWGDHPPLPSVLAQAAAETGDLRVVVGNPRDRSEEPAGGGAGEPRAGVHGTQLVSFTGLHEAQRNLPMVQIQRHRID